MSDLPTDPVRDVEADPIAVAKSIVLDLLARQARSRAELRQRLARKHVPDEVAEVVLDRFEQVGLIDDRAFAESWVRQRQAGRGLAPQALRRELRGKGVDDQIAAEALAQIDPATEESAARDLVRRKLRSMRGLDDLTATRRLAGMLARRGYGADLVRRVVTAELRAR